MGCFAYCAQCAFDRLRAMRFGDFGIECAYGAIYAKSIVGPGAGCAGKNLAMLWTVASAGNYFRNAEVQVCKEDRIIAFGLLEHDAVHTTIVPTDFADWTAAGVRTDRVCCQL